MVDCCVGGSGEESKVIYSLPRLTLCLGIVLIMRLNTNHPFACFSLQSEEAYAAKRLKKKSNQGSNQKDTKINVSLPSTKQVSSKVASALALDFTATP